MRPAWSDTSGIGHQAVVTLRRSSAAVNGRWSPRGQLRTFAVAAEISREHPSASMTRHWDEAQLQQATQFEQIVSLSWRAARTSFNRMRPAGHRRSRRSDRKGFDQTEERRRRQPGFPRRRFNEALQGPKSSIHYGMPPVTVDMPRRSVQNRTMVPLAWFCGMPHKARASCTLDLSRRDRKPAPARWSKAARGQQSIAAPPYRCPAQQFQMLWQCWPPAGSPATAPETRTRRCVLRC